MSEKNNQESQASETDNERSNKFSQRVKEIHQRFRKFDPAPYQQAYLRIFSLTSFLLAIGVFIVGIWAGFSLANLKGQVELSQQTQLNADLEFSDLVSEFQNNVNTLRTEFNEERVSLSTVDKFQAIIDQIAEVKANAYNESIGHTQTINALFKFFQQLSIAVLVAMIVLTTLLFVNLVLFTWSDFRTRRELRTLRNEWLEKGIKTGILKTTETLDLDPSVLRNIMSWMYDYGHNHKDVDAAFNLFTQLIARFSFLNFHPVGQIGEEVIFDPLHHQNIEADIHPGDTGYIFETGWMLDNQIIRKPLVVRRGI